MRQLEYSNDPITFGDRHAIQDTISRARGLSGLRLALRIYMHCRHVGPFPQMKPERERGRENEHIFMGMEGTWEYF